MTRFILLRVSAFILAIIFSVGFSESATRILYFLKFGRSFNESYQLSLAEKVHAKFDEINGRKHGFRDFTGTIFIHPYFGYTYLPDSPMYEGTMAKNFDSDHCFVNSQGFISVGSRDPFDTIVKRGYYAPDKEYVQIVISGGSVASQFICYSGKQIIDSLSHQGMYEGKTIEIIGISAGAWRQPQPLQALSYLYSLGVSPKLIISIDGFNEAANPYYMNNNETFPIYPFYWTRLIEGISPSPSASNLINDIYILNRLDVFFASAYSLFPYSSTLGFIFESLHSVAERRIINKVNELQSIRSNSFSVRGPKFDYSNDPGILSVDIWKNSILLMNNLAKQHGAIFLEILQPNILTTVKKFTDRELRIRGSWAHANFGIPRNHPSMRSYGKTMIARNNLNFLDFTDIFDESEQEIYVDPCHLTKIGNMVMYDHIMGSIMSVLSSKVNDPAKGDP